VIEMSRLPMRIAKSRGCHGAANCSISRRSKTMIETGRGIWSKVPPGLRICNSPLPQDELVPDQPALPVA
jgi:hypothetical protein